MSRRGRVAAALALALAAGLSACQTDASSPVKTEAMAWDPIQHQYTLGPVTLLSLTSLRHLRGGAGTLQAGGSVRASKSLIAAKGATVETLRAALVTSAPGEVDLTFSLSANIAYPEDADALQLVTAFYNLEQSRAAFAGWGLQSLPPAVLVAGAQLSGDDGRNPLDHAEMYFQPLETHYLPAPDQRTQLPLAMNLGAMAHSLMHQAIALGAWGNAPVPPTDQGNPKDSIANAAKHGARSMSEGLCDFVAGQVTTDPAWLDHSDQADAPTRALNQLRCSSPEMLQALAVDDTSTPYDPYPLGAVLSAALWSTADSTQPDAVARGALASLPKIKAAALAAGGKIGVADFLEAIAAATGEANAEVLPVLCGLFLDRFAKLSVASLPSCNGVSPTKPTDRCNCQPGDPGCG